MHFANPVGLWALLAVPAILVMYLLKRKHPELPVPSLFLWDKVLANSQAARPWQKLKRSLLLFLQLATAAVLALTLAEPVARGAGASAAGVFVLDTSLSMQATDETPNRLEAAKTAIREAVRQAPAGSSLSLVTMGAHASAVVNGVTDKAAFLAALDAVEPEDGGADLENALTLAGLLAEQTGGAVTFYTDTVYDYKTLDAGTVFLGESAENCSVELMALSSGTVLVKVRNNGQSEQNRTLTLYGDDVALDVTDLTLLPGEERDVYFSELSAGVTVFYARLSGGDILAADDSRYLVQNPDTDKKALLVTSGNVFLEKALGLLDGVTCYQATAPSDADRGYDLYIYDGVLPEAFPTDGNILLLNPENCELAAVSGSTGISAVTVGDPAFFAGRTQLDLAVSGTKVMSLPSWAENVLASPETPLIYAGETGGRRVAVIGFDLHQSDFPLQVEFPVFVYQLLEWFFPQSAGGQAELTAGETAPITLRPDAVSARVITPSGEEISLAPPFPAQDLTETVRMGVYTLVQEDAAGGTSETRFAINPAEGESDLKRSETMDTASGAGKVTRGFVSLRTPLLLILLALLAVEWWVNCRVR